MITTVETSFQGLFKKDIGTEAQTDYEYFSAYK